MSKEACETYRHDIDGKDRIIRVSPNWDRFALSNDGQGICAADVLMRPLMDFITGHEAQMIWRHLLSRVRKSQTPLSVPYRCDGPAVRRFMEMTINPIAHDGITFISSIVREERRDPLDLLDRAAPRSTDRIVMCSWCNRLRLDNRWIELDDAVRRGNLLSGSALPQLTHGICEDCIPKLMG